MSNRSAVIGLGANLGSPEVTLRAAVRGLRALAAPGGAVRVSSLYETAPVGPPQPSFLNAAVLLATERTPLQLLGELQRLEAEHGRQRKERWGPRTLDLDLLWIDGSEVRSPELVVPHPRLAQRLFALLPLLEVAPTARDPDGRPWLQHALALPWAGIRLVAGPSWAEEVTTS